MFRSLRLFGALCAATLATALAPMAFAQDVVVNGGFEDVSNTPWSPAWGNIGGFARSGDRSALTSCNGAQCLSLGGSGEFFQDVVTTPGTTYTLTFWYRTLNPGDASFELQALVSGGAPTSGGAGTCTGSCVFQTQTATVTYTQVTRTFVASSASTRITFLGRNDGSGIFLDDVSFVAAAPPVFAQDVVNGGFEDVSNTPWSPAWGNIGGFARSGDRSALTSCNGAQCLSLGGSGEFFQDVVTTPGTTYTLTFWYRTLNPGDASFELQALVSSGAPTSGGAGTCTGSCVFQTQTATVTYTQVTRTFVASSASTRITFLGRNDGSGIFLDDVSFVAAAPAPIPTLSEWAIILFGLALAGGAAIYLQQRQMAA